MENETVSDELITRYLLGDVSEKERDEIENLYRGDDDFFERLLIIEDDLLDSYVAGEMSDHERELFDRFFLISETRRQRLANARVLYSALRAAPAPQVQDVAAPEPWSWGRWFSRFWPTQNRTLQWVAGIALLVVAFGVLRFVLLNTSQPPSVNPSKIISFELGPVAVRSGNEARKLTIPRAAESVELKLYLRSDTYRSYHAEIKNTVTGPVWVGSNLPTQQADSSKVVIIVLPEELLPAGSYLLTLSGETDGKPVDIAAEYQFKVERE